MFRFALISVLMLLTGCQTAEMDMALRRAKADADQDQKCQSFGAKAGTPEYIHCRETLYAQARNEDAQRRQLAAAYLMSRPTPQPLQVYQPPVQRPLNCTSMRNGVMINTTCY